MVEDEKPFKKNLSLRNKTIEFINVNKNRKEFDEEINVWSSAAGGVIIQCNKESTFGNKRNPTRDTYRSL